MGAEIVFVDEGHFIKSEVIQNGPLAMLGQNASIVITSTPALGKSGIEGILTGELDGKPICTQIDLSYICAVCALRKIDDPTVECDHKKYLFPAMTSNTSMKIAAAATANDPAYYDREHAGVTIYNNYNYIDKRVIDSLRAAPRYYNKDIIKHLYVSIDPNRGSKHHVGDRNSDYAIITCYFENKKAVVNIYYVSM
jgi:hypothetical protein